ncbi:MAG: ribonuclease P protein component [Candidatus Obscuribacterales bacterium]|nr:ribonuclease P protein component [Candidatus Obscuribacterales bacterium]
MLPSAERLRKTGLFQRVYTARKVVSSEYFTLNVLPRQPRSSARNPLVGFVVGKKVHNDACKRNRAKRRVREAYRLLCRQNQDEDLNLGQWYALVFVIKAEILEAGWDQIVESLRTSLLKANQKFGARKTS